MSVPADKLERLAALEAARDGGVLKVKYSDKEVTYRSLDEIERIIEKLKSEISGKARGARIYMTTSKGLE